MSIPLPANAAPILDSAYLSMVQDNRAKIGSTGVSHLYLSSSPLQSIGRMVVHKDTQDTYMQLLEDMRSYMHN